MREVPHMNLTEGIIGEAEMLAGEGPEVVGK
jgi:hypothetical protein